MDNPESTSTPDRERSADVARYPDAAIECGVCGRMRAASVTAWALRKTEHGMKQVPLGICPECMAELRRSQDNSSISNESP